MPTDKKKAAESSGNRSERFEDLASQLRSGEPGSRLMQSNLAESIGFLLRLANGVSTGKLGQRFEVLGLRQSLYAVLLIIHENPGLKQQEVGQALSIQQPNLVALITELVNEGLVQRAINSEDRRSYSLALTAAGKQRLAQANRTHAENERWLATAVAPLSADQFRSALLRIAMDNAASSS